MTLISTHFLFYFSLFTEEIYYKCMHLNYEINILFTHIWHTTPFYPTFRYASFEKIRNFQTRELYYSYICDNYLRKNRLMLKHLYSAFIFRDLKSVTMQMPLGFTHLLQENIVMHLLPPTWSWNSIWTETIKQVWCQSFQLTNIA